jgi:hypothetical protein
VASYVRTKDAWTFTNGLRLYGPDGRQLWEFGGLDDKTSQPRIGDRFRAGLFASGGNKVVLLTDKKVMMLEGTRGAVSVPLATGNFVTAIPLGDDLLLADGDGKVVRFSPAQEKVLAQLDCAGAGPVTLALTDRGVVVGTETDGAVRLVRTVAGKLLDQTAWLNRVDTKIVKKVVAQGQHMAVSYWGGTLRLLDDRGKLRAEQVFGQDISDLALTGGQVVVGLADGRLVGLNPRLK